MIRRLLEAISGVSFNRGLALGAMVGAAIAGSTIWSRLKTAREISDPREGRNPREVRNLREVRNPREDAPAQP